MILVEVGLHKEFYDKVKALKPYLIKQNYDCQVCHKLMKVLELINIKENEDQYERDDSIESFVVSSKGLDMIIHENECLTRQGKCSLK